MKMKNQRRVRAAVLLALALAVTLPAGASGLFGRKKAQAAQQAALEEQRAAKMLSDFFFYEAIYRIDMNDYAAAYDILQHCEQLANTAAAKYELARLYIMMGDREHPEPLLKDAVALEPDNYWYRNLLASFYGSQYKYQESIQIFEEMASQYPSRTDVLRNLLDLYQLNRDWEKALSTLSRIETLDGGPSQESDIERFQIYLNMGRTDSAYSVIRSDCHWVISYMFDNISSLQELQQTEQLALYAVADDPQELDYYYYLAIIAMQTRTDAVASEWIEKGIAQITDKSIPSRAAQLYNLKGEMLYRQGNIDECLQVYETSISIDPDDAGSLNNYAYFKSLQGKDLDKALEYSRRTILLEPTNATYLDTYAWILFMKKDYKQAQQFIDLALQYDGDESADVLEHAGDIYYHLGDTDKARHFWNQAYAKGSTSAVLERKIIEGRYATEPLPPPAPKAPAAETAPETEKPAAEPSAPAAPSAPEPTAAPVAPSVPAAAEQ